MEDDSKVALVLIFIIIILLGAFFYKAFTSPKVDSSISFTDDNISQGDRTDLVVTLHPEKSYTMLRVMPKAVNDSIKVIEENLGKTRWQIVKGIDEPFIFTIGASENAFAGTYIVKVAVLDSRGRGIRTDSIKLRVHENESLENVK